MKRRDNGVVTLLQRLLVSTLNWKIGQLMTSLSAKT